MDQAKIFLKGQIDNETRGMTATRDHVLIRDWAEQRQAVPATGEATGSGPASIDVRDGGSGLRFNFPGAARFRPIDWEEWFEHFEAHRLVFVYGVEDPNIKASPDYELLTDTRYHLTSSDD